MLDPPEGYHSPGRNGYPPLIVKWWAAGFCLVNSRPFGHQADPRQTVLLQREAARFWKEKSRPEGGLNFGCIFPVAPIVNFGRWAVEYSLSS